MQAPLTPPECDLRDYPYIPLHIGRLKASRAWLLCKRNPALAFYLVNLWTAAFHAVPSGSLENDDMVLADIAMCDDATWSKVKGDALRGWVQGTDERLYHPTVCEQALEGWLQKLFQSKATAAATAKRKTITFDAKPFDRLIEDAFARLRAINPGSRALIRRSSKEAATEEERRNSPGVGPGGGPPGQPGGGPPLVQVVDRPLDRVAVQVKEREGKGNKREGPPTAGPPPDLIGDAQPTAVKAKRGRQEKPDVALPDDFALTPEMAAYATKTGFDPAWLFEKFTNKALAKGWTYRDWPAAFRNFAQTERQYAQPSPPRQNGAWRPPDV